MAGDKIRLLASSIEGFLEALILEASRFNLDIVEAHDYFVLLEGKKKDTAKFIMCSQTASNVMLYFCKISEDLVIRDYLSNISDVMIKDSLKFKVLSENVSKEDCKEVGILFEKQIGFKADITNYEISFGLMRDKEYYVGVNVYKKDFSKRDYRVYPSKQSSNPVLYASLVELAKVKDNLVFLDPICQDGTFAIEYALRSSYGIRMHESHLLEKRILSLFYDENSFIQKYSLPSASIHCSDELMGNLSKAKQNSRLAGIEKNISFGRMPIQYLVLKHEKKSIGFIATKINLVSKIFSLKKYDELLSRLLKSASLILKKDHKIILLSNEKELTEKRLMEYGFYDIEIYEYRKGESILYGIISNNGGIKNRT